MRYIIYGAGAIGGAIGAKLHQHGHDVVLIARGAHLQAMRDNGLKFETPQETAQLQIPVAGHPDELTFGDGDVVLLTMKSQHTEAALEDLRAAAGPAVPVICAQNGVDNERMALRRFEHVYAMLVLLPATYMVPGVVQAHAAPVSGILDAGCYPSGTDHLIMRVTADIDASGFSARPTADIMRWKYAKLLNNLGNAVQAACGHDSDALQLHGRLREEAIACYRAAGIDWASEEEMAERRKSMSRPAAIAGSTRGGGSSWQSIARGAGSIETDYFNGEIALLGRMYGVPTPLNAAMQRVAIRVLRDSLPVGSVPVSEVEAAG